MKFSSSRLTDSTGLAHAVALLTVVLWSLTFVQTKVLLEYLSPVEILLDRFSIAWALFWIFDHRIVMTSLREEFLFALLGATGIFGYYILENIALQYTQAIHVGLIVTTAPLFTIVILLLRKPLEKRDFLANIGGFIPVAAGLYLMSYDRLSGFGYGDLLALSGAMSFAGYSVLLSTVDTRFDARIVTRKSLFYGVAFLSLYAAVTGESFHWRSYTLPSVWSNLLLLAMIASGLCFLLWRWAIAQIGSSAASAYIYLVPLINALAAVWVLREMMSIRIIIAGVLILGGLILSQRHTSLGK